MTQEGFLSGVGLCALIAAWVADWQNWPEIQMACAIVALVFNAVPIYRFIKSLPSEYDKSEQEAKR